MSLIGLPVYNSKKEHKGTVTERYKDDEGVEVLLINDDYEVEISMVDHVLWTLKPDTRGEHIRFK